MTDHSFQSFAALFEAQVRRRPQATAVREGSVCLSYDTLNRRANRLAHLLRQHGVGRESLVAVALPRGVQLVVSELAALKAGAAFLPVDPAYPAQRIAFMLDDARPRCVITHRALAPDLPQPPVQIVIDEAKAKEALAAQPEADPTVDLGPDDLAYVIYTSGSTGRPKAVMVPQRGVAPLAAALVSRLAVDEDARVAQLASPSFDASVMEMLMAFGAGATLVTPLRTVMAGDILAEVLTDYEISHALIPPATLATLPAQAFEHLRALAVGGEACPPGLAARWSEGRRMINAYGPTEITVCATMSEPLGSDGRVPIGRPIPHTRVLVLDDRLRPTPVGVAGELYIAGSGLARGYLGRAALTAERFVANPYAKDGSRMYRTGDLVRWTHDKTLEYVGRSDDQVKIRGFRIELGEIESLLGAHPAVARCAVVVGEDAAAGKRLLACYTEREGHTADAAQLRGWLAQRLPEFMLPAAFARIDVWPLSPNGKLDRAALPAVQAAAAAPARAPSTPTEKRLCEIYAQTLGLASVDDAHANFFELGGHSLLAIQVGKRIRDEWRADFPVVGVYTVPVIADLAALLDGKAAFDEHLALDQDAHLPAHIALPSGAVPHARATDIGRVFLTGATGYVGTHLLARLLRDTRAQVACLVRAAHPEEGRQRLRQALADQRLERHWRPERVEILLGDLSKPDLGLDAHGVARVQQDCDVLLHCGAKVDFLHPYASLKAANVDSTLTLLEWSVTGPLKPLHFISTLGIVDTVAFQNQDVTEDTPLNAWRGLVGGYSQSKWVADALAVQARERGLPVSIHRLGSVTGDHEHALCNPTDFLWQLALMGAAMQALPDIDLPLNLTPVDDVARAVVTVMTTPDLPAQVYHLLGPRTLRLLDVAPVLADLGLEPRVVSMQEWRTIAQAHLKDRVDDDLLAILAILSKYDHRHAGARARIGGERTGRVLQRLGAAVSAVDADLLARYLVNLGLQADCGREVSA